MFVILFGISVGVHSKPKPDHNRPSMGSRQGCLRETISIYHLYKALAWNIGIGAKNCVTKLMYVKAFMLGIHRSKP